MAVDLYESLSGQTALVTGATRGIGEAIAVELADLGATVYAGARDPADITQSELRPVRLDVTDRDEIEAAMDTIESAAGRLDVLVNNAAIHGPHGPLGEIGVDAIQATLRTNLDGPIVVTKHALGLLTRNGGSRVVNVTSGAGQFSTGISAENFAYGISKAGLNAFTAGFAAQYDDLIVSAVSPGWTRTDMGGPDADRSVAEGADTPVWLARFREGPSGRFWKDRAIEDW